MIMYTNGSNDSVFLCWFTSPASTSTYITASVLRCLVSLSYKRKKLEVSLAVGVSAALIRRHPNKSEVFFFSLIKAGCK